MEPEKLSSTCVSRLVSVLQIAMLAATLACMSGCATSSYKKADAASSSLQRAAFEINAESHAIDGVMAALDDLINKPASDIRPQFERFDASLNNLISASDRAEKAAATASKKSEDYFQNWDKNLADIHYQAVRDQSEARKTEVSTEFNTVDQRYHENQGVVEPLIAYLRDIRTALSADLTAGGLVSVKGLADNAQQNARKVQTALAQLSDDFSASGNRMSSMVVVEATQPRGGADDSTQTTQQQHAQSTATQ